MTGSPLPYIHPLALRTHPLSIFSRALSSLPARTGAAPGRYAPLLSPCLPLKERHAGEGRPGGGETGRAPGRQGARTHRGTQRAQSRLGRRAPPCRPMLCSMANSGCLLLSNSGSMLPHSVPCPPAFLYLQQVSAPRPSAPRSCARAPRAAAHAPHLAASAPPLVAPRLSSRHGARAWVRGTAPLSGRGAWGRPGRVRCRVGGLAGVWGVARNFF